MPALRDIATTRPRVLFVGINPSLRSAQLGHHFAGRGNQFWRLLYGARLVSLRLTCEQEEVLAAFGLALTNFCPRPTRSASELAPRDFASGRVRLMRKIRRWHPRVVAFVGVGIYRRFFGKTARGGPGAKPEHICDARVFVLPNPSGLNATFPGFKDKLIWFKRLRRFATLNDKAAPRTSGLRHKRRPPPIDQTRPKRAAARAYLRPRELPRQTPRRLRKALTPAPGEKVGMKLESRRSDPQHESSRGAKLKTVKVGRLLPAAPQGPPAITTASVNTLLDELP